MADRDAFEKHCMGNHIGGSNPSPSVFKLPILNFHLRKLSTLGRAMWITPRIVVECR